MFSRLFVLPGAAFFLGFSSPAAVALEDLQASGSSDNLVVTANRLPRERLKVGSTTYVITGEEIRARQLRQVSDVLRAIPGMSVVRNGSFGGATTVRHRGAKNGQTLILVDGVRINDPSSIEGGYDFAFLSTGDIERVEVLSGPQSTLYGGDAVAGVINIITRGAAGGVAARAETGSYSTNNVFAQIANDDERVSVRASLEVLGTDGISKADENGGNFEDDAYDNLTASGRVRLRLTDATELTATGRFLDSETQYDNGFPIEDGDFVTTTKQWWTGLTLSHRAFGGKLENALSAEVSDFERREGGADNFFPSAAKGSRAEVGYQGAWQFDPDTALLFGAEYDDSELEPISLFGASEASIDNTAVFILYQFAPLESLDVTVGARRDRYDTDVGTQDDAETTGRITAAWNVADTGFTLRASYGEGFKAPSLYQLTYTENPVDYPPNRNLKPQTNEGWDAGIEYQARALELYTQLTVFRDDTDDQIDYVFNPLIGTFGAGRYENIDSVRREGLEWVLGGNLTEALSFRLNAAYVSAENRADGQQLSRVPRRTASLNLAWKPGERTRYFADLRAQSEQDDSPFNSAVTAGFGVLDVGGEWTADNGLTFFGRIENLLDKEYQEVLGYGTPDRSIYAGVRFSL